jgi:hypothetical protein
MLVLIIVAAIFGLLCLALALDAALTGVVWNRDRSVTRRPDIPVQFWLKTGFYAVVGAGLSGWAMASLYTYLTNR